MTEYVGNVKGEEIADYTLNYKGLSGSETVSTSTVYFYLATHVRSTDGSVDSEDPMTASNTIEETRTHPSTTQRPT